MAVNFPDNPSNGQTVTFGSTTYTYNSTKGIWSSSGTSTSASVDNYLEVANSTVFVTKADAVASNNAIKVLIDDRLQVANAITLTSFDVLTSTPSGNGSLVYNSSNGSFTFTPANATQGGGGGGGGASVTASDTAPSSPSAGDLWFHTTQLKLYVYYSDGSSNQWIQTNSGVGNRVDEFIKAYRYQGTLAINTGDTRLYLQDSYILKGIHAYVDTAPTGSSVITDVKKNGSSLQTITVAAGATTASNTSLSHTFVSGDYLTVDITQVGSSTAGTNLYMVFTFN